MKEVKRGYVKWWDEEGFHKVPVEQYEEDTEDAEDDGLV